jgi:hypothetical protein
MLPHPSDVETAAQPAAIRLTHDQVRSRQSWVFSLHTPINGDIACNAVSRRSAKMMTEDAKFALGF